MWRYGEYKKQSWGIWLHSIAPYVGRMKPALAHWLVRVCSKPGDILLDPFCGIGTVLLEADLLGRIPIGIELNPYALVVCKAKFDRKPLKEHINWLKSIKIKEEEIDLSEISPYIKQFYHEKTLKELFALKEVILKERKFFLLGCLLGIAHGHRPQYLSSMTGYIIPHKSAKHIPTYKPVIPRLIEKVKRMYMSEVPLKTEGQIIKADARKIPLKNDSVDVVISSPPYYSTIDYIESNRLRLALLGYDADKRKHLKDELIQHDNTYLSEMRKVGFEIRRVLKPKSLCIFVLGDYYRQNSIKNTAKDVSELYSELNFVTHGIIEDEIPATKRTVPKWSGSKALEKIKKKFDRILIMQIEK